ncbi:hypothetical protein [Pseudomonas aeruginosa]|uniref:hypothetical protein n=1 Tax=Pseudomonas aeruginosa TaxID=287 RepID=UPI001BC9B823|nr:hypothetical protein [Pseudomonas aeruginosa]
MTDTNKLKVWAEALVIRAGSAGPDISADVLGLIEEVEKLRADTSSMRGSLNANSKSMKKLIKDGTKVTKELDRLRAENETLRGALQAVVDDPTWRSNDNTLWPKIIKAMDKGATK